MSDGEGTGAWGDATSPGWEAGRVYMGPQCSTGTEPKDLSSGGHVGSHAVKIVGWGVKDGVKYWQVAALPVAHTMHCCCAMHYCGLCR